MSALTLLLTGLGTGLVAGGASCAAVQGGLLAGAVTRRTGAQPTRPDDVPAMAPVGAFLAGKLITHTALGAALGAFGSGIQLPSRVRAMILIAAAVLMLFFALELLGLRIARRWAPRPPIAWTRLVQRTATSNWAITPLLLGLATILLPCGVTLSMELLAITSSSPLNGAAVMAGFVLGTVPLFAVLGYALRRTTQILQGRLRIATGAILLVVAGFTAFSGLTLSGRISPSDTAETASNALPAAPLPADSKPQIVTIGVLNNSFSPRRVTVQANHPTTLVLRTEKTTGCTRDFVIPSLNIEKVLPETGKTVIDLGLRPPGKLNYTCAMGMHTGTIYFRAPAAR